MNEIKLFYDAQMEKEVINGEISFEAIKSGSIARRILYAYNLIKYSITLRLSIIGKDVILMKDNIDIRPAEQKQIILEFTPKEDAMEPIKASLNITLFYTVS